MTAGLFAPVEMLLVDEGEARSSLTYVKSSSLMVIEQNSELLSAAKELDAKLAALAAKVTAARERHASHPICSTHCARDGPGSNASLKYCVSRTTSPPSNSMMLTT